MIETLHHLHNAKSRRPMRRLRGCVALWRPVVGALLILFLATATVPGQGVTPEPPKPKSPSGAKAPPKPRPKPRPKPGKTSGSLLVFSTPGGCDVTIDGVKRGETDSSGWLEVKDLPPGGHTVVVQKEGYKEQAQVCSLEPAGTVNVSASLEPVPGRLAVTANVPGVYVRIEGVGEFPVTEPGIELAPGRYRVEVSRLGYRTARLEVDVDAGDTNRIRTDLDPMTVKELTAEAEDRFNSSKYDDAIALCQLALGQKSDKKGALLILGASLFRLGRLFESVDPVVAAIRSGEQVAIAVDIREASSRPVDPVRYGYVVLRSTGIGLRSTAGDGGPGVFVPWSQLKEFRADGSSIRFGASIGASQRINMAMFNTLKLDSGPVARPDLRARDADIAVPARGKDKAQNIAYWITGNTGMVDFIERTVAQLRQR